MEPSVPGAASTRNTPRQRLDRHVAVVARDEAAIRAVLIDSDPIDAEIEGVGAFAGLRCVPEVAIGARLELLAVEGDEETDAKAVVLSIPKTRIGRRARAASPPAPATHSAPPARAARRASVRIPAPSKKEKKAASQRQPPGRSADHRKPRLTRSEIRRAPWSERAGR